MTIPGAAGEQGIAASTTSSAPTAITMGTGSDTVGFEYHTAADAFGIDGFKASISASFNDDVAASTDASTATLENSYAVGVTYVTTQGDTTVTIGAGFLEASDADAETSTDTSVYNMGVLADNGDLTVGAGVGGAVGGAIVGTAGGAMDSGIVESGNIGLKVREGTLYTYI